MLGLQKHGEQKKLEFVFFFAIQISILRRFDQANKTFCHRHFKIDFHCHWVCTCVKQNGGKLMHGRLACAERSRVIKCDLTFPPTQAVFSIKLAIVTPFRA